MIRAPEVSLTPTWWPIVVARYRRLSPLQRSTLEIVVSLLWSRHRPGETEPAEVSGRALALLTDMSENHAQRCLAALLAPPGAIVEKPPRLVQGHGILRIAKGRAPGLPRLVDLNPWREWGWSSAAEVTATAFAVSRLAEPPELPEAEHFARMLLTHMQAARWASGKEPKPRARGWPAWVQLLDQLVDRGYTREDLARVLGYVEDIADPHWRRRLRGPHAARRLLNDWECLILRVRRQE